MNKNDKNLTESFYQTHQILQYLIFGGQKRICTGLNDLANLTNQALSILF